MKTTALAIALFISGISILAYIALQKRHAKPDVFQSRYDVLCEAFKAGDTAPIEKLEAPDFVHTTVKGVVKSREKDLADLKITFSATRFIKCGAKVDSVNKVDDHYNVHSTVEFVTEYTDKGKLEHGRIVSASEDVWTGEGEDVSWKISKDVGMNFYEYP